MFKVTKQEVVAVISTIGLFVGLLVMAILVFSQSDSAFYP